MKQAAPLLQVDAIRALYDEAIVALHDVSLAVADRSIVALLGANGAGKTTTLKAISNLLGAERGKLARGSITWQGRDTRKYGPAEIVRQGIVQVLEGRHVFPQLTVEENILTGAFLRRLDRRELAANLERVYQWFPRLKERRKSRAGLTSGGEQQMVAISRALMTQPKLVLLDEPSMGLAPIIVDEIFEIIRQLNREQGIAFVVAEQNTHLVLRYADYAYLLENGRVALEGEAAALATRNDIQSYYLGGQAAESNSSLS